MFSICMRERVIVRLGLALLLRLGLLLGLVGIGTKVWVIIRAGGNIGIMVSFSVSAMVSIGIRVRVILIV